MALGEGIFKVLSVALKSNFRPCLARKKNVIFLYFYGILPSYFGETP